jgi:hypothetical protein
VPADGGERAGLPIVTADARHFLTAFGIVSLLLVTLTGALVARVAAVGEVLSIDEGAALRGTLFADYAAYKREITVRRRPELLVLGSSRVMAVRGQHFSECQPRGCFDNAGGGSFRSGLGLSDELLAYGLFPFLAVVGGMVLARLRPGLVSAIHAPGALRDAAYAAAIWVIYFGAPAATRPFIYFRF